MAESPRRVSDVMTRTVVAVGREASFREVVEIMGRWKVSAVPVLEGEGRVIGVVSEADLLPKEEFRDDMLERPGMARQRFAELVKAWAVTAEELMSSPAVTVHADATVAEAARTMAIRRVKRLPVIDGEAKLCGIVSRADLLKVFLRSDEELQGEVRGVLLADPLHAFGELRMSVSDGVVTLSGQVRDAGLIPVVVRLVRGVEGVVDVAARIGVGAPS
ncbi:CBS domain-containing protein [Streptomyces pactum]|uniref:CBS domain-containing protein n=1 Tax=Streptomyces pactum TaxID=68249 RepID=A0ABS0NFE2_9ACTN|nr:CBS domain-containing protein [Streptomyces pactum]MBH5333899.1 CBS domain-containing protein [Streptomyces pactum]